MGILLLYNGGTEFHTEILYWKINVHLIEILNFLFISYEIIAREFIFQIFLIYTVVTHWEIE